MNRDHGPCRGGYAQLHAIVDGARVLSGVALETYLTDACAGDSSLRRPVEQLLAAGHDEVVDPFAEASVGNSRVALGQLVDSATADWLPEQIGDYTIVRQIGRGGMGIVYEAEQKSPRRSVAIKLLHPMHATELRVRRLRQEAEALGRLQHRGIAQIYEAGHYDVGHGPQPFLAMELVHGVDLCTYSEREALSLRARLELLAKVADAVQHAHDHGVIHRDLKPDNVLVNERGRPRVLDFGIARVLDEDSSPTTLLTEAGQLIGTLGYMAPEQLREGGEVKPQTDVYALGVLGFELLTRRLPRVAGNLPVSRAVVRFAEGEAPAAGSIDLRLKGDIETILGKALEVDPARRYRSAAALAADLRRYLADQPIEARPPSGVYLVRKFARRHRALVGGVVATLSVAITGAVLATGYAVDAVSRAAELEREVYVSSLAATVSALQVQDYDAAATILERAPEAHRGWEYDYLRAKLEQHTADWEAPAPVRSRPVFDRAGERMFAVMANNTIGTWDTASGQLLRTVALDLTVVASPVASTEILLHGPARRFACRSVGGELAIGDLESGQAEVVAAPGVRVVAWDAGGQRLLVYSDKMRVWDGATFKVVSEELFQRGAFSPAGDRIVLGNGQDVALIDAESGELLHRVKLSDTVSDIAFALDGRTIAVAGNYRNVILLDGADLRQTLLSGHQDIVWAVRWAADGRLVTTSNDLTTRVWRRGVNRSTRVFCDGAQEEPWNTATAPMPPGVAKLAVTPDGSCAVVAGDHIRVVPLDDPTILAGHQTFVYRLAFSPDGSMLASSTIHGSETIVWDVRDGCERWRFHPTGPHGGSAAAPGLAFSADGRRVFSGSDTAVVAWDIRSGEPLPGRLVDGDRWGAFFEVLGPRWGDRVLPGGCAMRADGAMVAFPGEKGVRILAPSAEADPSTWNPWGAEPTGTVAVGRLEGHRGRVYCVAFSPDGTRLATGGNDATVRIWDARTFEQLLVLRGHELYVHDVAWSPDGTLLASASGDATVRLWDSLPLHERRALAGR